MDSNIFRERLAAIVASEAQQDGEQKAKLAEERELARLAKPYFRQQLQACRQAESMLEDAGTRKVETVPGDYRRFGVATSNLIWMGKIEGVMDPLERNNAFAEVEVAKVLERDVKRKWLVGKVVEYAPVETSYFGVKLYTGTKDGEESELEKIADFNSYGVDTHRRLLVQGDATAIARSTSEFALKTDGKELSEITDTLNMIESRLGEFRGVPLKVLDELDGR